MMVQEATGSTHQLVFWAPSRMPWLIAELMMLQIVRLFYPVWPNG